MGTSSLPALDAIAYDNWSRLRKRHALRGLTGAHLQVVYPTGAGLMNKNMGLLNFGFVVLSQAIEHTIAIRNVVALPVFVEANAGFANAVNVTQATRALLQAAPPHDAASRRLDRLQAVSRVTVNEEMHWSARDPRECPSFLSRLRLSHSDAAEHRSDYSSRPRS